MEVETAGREAWVRLDRSAFYPASGGQLADLGTLTLTDAGATAIRVTDVQLRAGLVWLRVEGAPSLVAGESRVMGRIDWGRRYRLMQRHTAQHLLSQALVRVDPSFATLSVSMRNPECTIDFAGEVQPDQLKEVELEANRAARRSYPVMTFEVAEAELGRYALRRPPKVSGTIRLVAVGGYDLVACGGTHVRLSSEVLPIKLLGVERVKGSLNRLAFAAGEEARADHAARFEVTSALSAALSAPLPALVERVGGLEAKLRAQGEELGRLKAGAAALLAERLTKGVAPARDGVGVLTALLEGEEAALLDELVGTLQGRAETVSLLAAAVQGSGQVRFAFVAGPGGGADVRPLLKAALEEVGGRGGGSGDRAQGAAVVDVDGAQRALAVAAELLDSLPE